MTPPHIRGITAALLVAATAAACSRATGRAAESSPRPATATRGEQSAIARARVDSARRPYTTADIDFMTHMIGHHSQAIVMAKWAPSHGASDQLQILAARIINAQRDEIATMQRWLRDRLQPVPAADTTWMGGGMGMMMHGSEHHAMMPGMLTAAQMHQLDQARGEEFDRLFLRFMIQHHQGAMSMVKELFGTYGAAQDELTFKLASDINVDQKTEVARMQKMLVVLTFGIVPGNQPAGSNP